MDQMNSDTCLHLLKIINYTNVLVDFGNINDLSIKINIIKDSQLKQAQPAMDLPTATQEQFQNFIQEIKSVNYQNVERITQEVDCQELVNRLQTVSRQPSLYFASLIEGDEQSCRMLELLVGKGAKPDHKDANQQTVMFYLCRQGKIKCIDMLLRNGCHLEETDVYGQNPIFYAASQNRLDIINTYSTKELINRVDILAGQTPIYYAARRGHLEMCKLLINKGADVLHIDNNNKTVIDYAKKAKFNDVVAYLAEEFKKLKEIKGGASQSIEESNVEKRKTPKQQNKNRQNYKMVYYNDKGELIDLTEEQVFNLLKDQPQILGYVKNPQTIPQEKLEVSSGQSWEKVATKLLANCIKLKGAFWFMEPVDPVKFNIMDYFDIIQKPMDLGTIKKKLTHNCYASGQQFCDDFELIWKNCYKYNGETHEISKWAKELEASYRENVTSTGMKKYLDIPREEVFQSPQPQPPQQQHQQMQQQYQQPQQLQQE